MTEKITVYLPVWAQYSIVVELEEGIARDDAIDDAIEKAYEKLPSGLCHQCSTGNTGAGWGKRSEIYLELGDEPEAKYALDEKGAVVWGDIDAELSW